jgi:hypothetical protein
MKPMAALRKHQHGAVAIMVGLAIFVLIAFLGMTVDLGRLFITKTELSNAADACALAAAAQLDGAADSLDRAESAGITVGESNKVGFQGSLVVIVPDQDVSFSDQLADDTTFRPKTAIAPSAIANMRYAKCTLPQGGIYNYFMQAVGFVGPQTVASHAVASLVPGITNCGLPIAICQNKTPPATCADGISAPDAMGHCKNEWVCSKFTTGGGNANPTACPGYGSTGNFNLIDYSPPSGGASELAEIITGTGQCDLNIAHPVGQTGVEQSISKAWNTRFGLYKGSDSVSTAPPDYSGFAYTPTSWPSRYRAFDGTSANGAPNLQSARTSNLVYQENAGTWPDGIVLNGYQPSTSAELAASGSDRRIAVVPVVDCDLWAGSQTVPIIRFACIVMLHPMDSPGDPLYLEYQGLSDLPGSPCSSIGLPGGPGNVGPMVPALVR